ncbi:hypothetical protein BC828DRAFT_409760, partial [Blastocladiella britannica]
WWRIKCAEQRRGSKVSSWTAALAPRAAALGRLDRLDWAWEHARDSAGFEQSRCVEVALEDNKVAVLDWFWDRRDALPAEIWDMHTDSYLAAARATQDASSLVWWQAHVGVPPAVLIRIAESQSQLSVAGWWARVQLGGDHATLLDRAANLEDVCAASTPTHYTLRMLVYWRDLCERHGQPFPIDDQTAFKCAIESDRPCAFLDWWRAYSQCSNESLLAEFQNATLLALQYRRYPSFEWWVNAACEMGERGLLLHYKSDYYMSREFRRWLDHMRETRQVEFYIMRNGVRTVLAD